MIDIKYSGNCTIVTKDRVIVNGEEIMIPSYVKRKNGNSTSTINNKVFINGYQYFPKTKVFKKTLRGLWHYWF